MVNLALYNLVMSANIPADWFYVSASEWPIIITFYSVDPLKKITNLWLRNFILTPPFEDQPIIFVSDHYDIELIQYFWLHLTDCKAEEH